MALVSYPELKFIEWNIACTGLLSDLSTETKLDEVLSKGEFRRLQKNLEMGKVANFDFSVDLLGDQSVIEGQASLTEIDANEKVVMITFFESRRAREAQSMLDSYSKMLEKKNEILEQQIRQNESLLLNILPRKVMEELREKGKTIPERFSEVSVLFLDFVNFTKMPVSKEPENLFKELNELFSEFDYICAKRNCERIKTIGDAYLAVCGLPEPIEGHADRIVECALEIRDYLVRRNEKNKIQWKARIGLHTGEVIGGVVGLQKYIYDIFGEGINIASRMESSAPVMGINLSGSLKERLSKSYKLEDRGIQEVKGNIKVHMFLLNP